MDPEVLALFHELVDRSPSERDGYYAKRRVPAALRTEVESLLRFDGSSEPSLSPYVAAVAHSALLEDDSTSLAGRYGSYRLVRLIGRGGMGAVYEAEQDRPRRSVALKIIKPSLAGPAMVRRFELELQALGRLHHPGIAQIYEAGTADVGAGPQPYFAMELVRGEPLLQYADSHGLATSQRLELLARICDAVDHAHQRGIIHRDLKPANIIVDENGQPKILDFGVARVTDSDVQSTRHTEVGQLVGTLAYMSPEQVRADPLELDTRSDVYSLGVVLYELLGRRLPYTTTHQHEMARAICDEDPVPLATINRAYRGDIEIIVAKALEKDKERRYGSVAALAEDIRRHLRDEPIVARPAGNLYHLRKFTKRHGALVGGAMTVFVVLAAGVIVSTWQATRARRAEQAATQEAAATKAINDFLQHDLLAQASAYSQAKPDTTPDPDLTVRTALDRAAQNIGGRFDRQPLVEASLRSTIGETYAELGLYADALKHFDRSLELQRRVAGDDHPNTLVIMGRLAQLQMDVGDYAQAERLASAVLDGRRRVLGTDHLDTLAALLMLSDVYRFQRKHDKAEPILENVLARFRHAKGDAHPDTLQAQAALVSVYVRMGKLAPAEALSASLVEAARREFGEEHPHTLLALSDRVSIYDAQGRYAEGLQLAERLVEVKRRVLGEEHRSTLVDLDKLATLHLREGNYAQAEAILARHLETSRRVVGPESDHTLVIMTRLGALYVEEGKLVEAESTLRPALAARRRRMGEDNPATLATAHFLAQLYMTRGGYAAAETLLTNVQETRRRVLSPAHSNTLLGMHDLGVLYTRWGKYEQAESLFREAIAGRRKVFGDRHPDTLASMLGLVDAQVRHGKYAEAEALSQETLAGYVTARPNNWRRYKAETLRGAILVYQSKIAEAEPLLLSGYKGLLDRAKTIPAIDRPVLSEAKDRISRLASRTVPTS